MTATGCTFCKIVKGELSSEIVHRDDRVTAFKDINPQAPIHILVVPNEHIPSIDEASDEQAELIGRLFITAKRLAKTMGFASKGYRLVINNGRAAGQSIDHVHLHVLSGRGFSWPPG